MNFNNRKMGILHQISNATFNTGRNFYKFRSIKYINFITSYRLFIFGTFKIIPTRTDLQILQFVIIVLYLKDFSYVI